MKRYLSVVCSLILALALVSCGARAAGGASEPDILPEVSVPVESSSQSGEPDHSHQQAEADNIIPHDPVGYCGNTVTRVSPEPRTSGEDWKASFWGGDSVALTDLLVFLDYSGDICRCLPEYYVDTEFSEEPYGLNLSSGYARHGEGQAELTEEQVELIRDILERSLTD